MQFVGERILAAAAAVERAAARSASLTPEQQSSLERGGTIYNELCFACHGPDGRGTPTPGAAGSTLAPSLAGSPRVNGHRDYVIKAVMHGLSGPIDGRTYPQVMVPMGSNNDQWIADVASYVRNSFGNSGALATPADVARVRAATGIERQWTVAELEASLPRALVPDTDMESHRQPRRASVAARQRRRGLQLSEHRGRRADLSWLDDRRRRSSRACGFRSSSRLR